MNVAKSTKWPCLPLGCLESYLMDNYRMSKGWSYPIPGTSKEETNRIVANNKSIVYTDEEFQEFKNNWMNNFVE